MDDLGNILHEIKPQYLDPDTRQPGKSLEEEDHRAAAANIEQQQRPSSSSSEHRIAAAFERNQNPFYQEFGMIGPTPPDTLGSS